MHKTLIDPSSAPENLLFGRVCWSVPNENRFYARGFRFSPAEQWSIPMKIVEISLSDCNGEAESEAGFQ